MKVDGIKYEIFPLKEVIYNLIAVIIVIIVAIVWLSYQHF